MKRGIPKTTALVLATLFLLVRPGFVQEEDANVCAVGSADAGIEACTRVLQREIRESASRRAITLTYRGLAWKSKGELDNALRDITEAIEADSSLASAYFERAEIHREKNECERAISDYDQVIRLL